MPLLLAVLRVRELEILLWGSLNWITVSVLMPGLDVLKLVVALLMGQLARRVETLTRGLQHLHDLKTVVFFAARARLPIGKTISGLMTTVAIMVILFLKSQVVLDSMSGLVIVLLREVRPAGALTFRELQLHVFEQGLDVLDVVLELGALDIRIGPHPSTR